MHREPHHLDHHPDHHLDAAHAVLDARRQEAAAHRIAASVEPRHRRPDLPGVGIGRLVSHTITVVIAVLRRRPRARPTAGCGDHLRAA